MKFKFTFLVIIFSGLALYYLIRAGFYPVAVVNYTIISRREFTQSYQAATVYYKNALAAYVGKELDNKSARELVVELRRAVLDHLIENVLIYNELENRVGSELVVLSEKKIPPFRESAALAVYGLNAADFKELVLVPQAQREILESRLESENGNLDEWLTDARKSATVVLLMFGFEWDGASVKVEK